MGVKFLFGGVEGRECVSSRESATEREEKSRGDEGWAVEGGEGRRGGGGGGESGGGGGREGKDEGE